MSQRKTTILQVKIDVATNHWHSQSNSLLMLCKYFPVFRRGNNHWAGFVAGTSREVSFRSVAYWHMQSPCPTLPKAEFISHRKFLIISNSKLSNIKNRVGKIFVCHGDYKLLCRKSAFLTFFERVSSHLKNIDIICKILKFNVSNNQLR